MSDTTPEPTPTGTQPTAGDTARPAPATAPAESAAAEPRAAQPRDTDTDLQAPPPEPVSARGHVNRPRTDDAEGARSAGSAAPAGVGPAAAAAAAAPAAVPATTPHPPRVTEPEPVQASDDEIAAAVARSAAQPGEPGASAGGDATADTASPAQSATPVIAAAEAANLRQNGDTTATAVYGAAPAAAGAGAAGTAAVTAPSGPQPVTPIYVQRPEPPKKKSNRGFGILIALVGTVVYAVLWTAAVFIVGALLTPSDEFLPAIARFYTEQYSGWAPVVAFFIGMAVLVQILNRARWWAYILGGLFVAIFVYLVYVGAAVLDANPWNRTPEELDVVLRSVWLGAFAILAGIIAREVSVWTGAWLAGRGRKLKARNAEARADYDQQVADAQNQAVAAYAGQQGY